MAGLQVNYGGGWQSPQASQGYMQKMYRDVAKSNIKGVDERLKAQEALAQAEVDADAAQYEAEQNRQAGQQAFQFALSNATARRPVGGGITRGGYGRRGATINSATGGLAAANAAARKKTMGALAKARLEADPETQRLKALRHNSLLMATGKGLSGMFG